MATYSEGFAQVLLRCQSSSMFFIENFCKVKHQKAGILPFNLFSYQRKSILDFLKHRFVIYKKTRQCGVSTLAGAFALWYAMFYPYKTVLIVSKKDDDAMAFLNKNVKFVYENLPKDFRDVYGWPPPTYNEHTIVFPNGSIIRSLTCEEDTLRSNSSSLNIIDESAFIWCMDSMWSGGASTVMQGGNVIVISTCNGVGNWYEVTWNEALKGNNVFYPIQIDWWDMDWELMYIDELNGQQVRIAPRDNIRKCETKDDLEKWGVYYSPWLEEQWNILALRGEAYKFKQEVLAEFIGSGNTVVTPEKLKHIETTVDDNYKIVETVDYAHPITGLQMILNFEGQLHIWTPPVMAEPDIVENGRIIKPGRPGHVYAFGVDISSGEADDYSSIVMIDLTIMEQVAELNIKVLPTVLEQMMDFIGRWYNNAFCVPERTGMGIPVCQSFYSNYAYANIYRMTLPGGKLSKKVGFPTSPVYKPALNKCLLDCLGPDGITIKSRRLFQQLCIYVYKGSRTEAVDGPGNHDDLSIALALSLMGVGSAVAADQRGMIPSKNVSSETPELSVPDLKQLNNMATMGGLNALVPYLASSGPSSANLTPDEELRRFTNQLGGTTVGSNFANPNFANTNPVHKRRNTIIHRPNK